MVTTFDSQGKDKDVKNNQGAFVIIHQGPLLLLYSNNFIHTMITRFNIIGFFKLVKFFQTMMRFLNNVKSVESYEDYPKKSDSGGVGGTICIYTRY